MKGRRGREGERERGGGERETDLLVLVVVGGLVRFVFVHAAVAFGT